MKKIRREGDDLSVTLNGCVSPCGGWVNCGWCVLIVSVEGGSWDSNDSFTILVWANKMVLRVIIVLLKEFTNRNHCQIAAISREKFGTTKQIPYGRFDSVGVNRYSNQIVNK